MKYLARGGLGLGVIVLVILIAREGVQSIVALLDQAGWRLLLLVPLHAAVLLLDVLGWRALVLVETRLGVLLLVATIREAVNRLLPVANVGGELVGIRLLARKGISGAVSAASIVVETLLNIVAQYLLFLLGLALLLHISTKISDTKALFILFTGPVALFVFAFWLLRSGALFKSLIQIGSKLTGVVPSSPSTVESVTRLDAAIRRLMSAYGRLARGISWQLVGLVAGCSETWLALRWLGQPVSWQAAFILESFTLTFRSIIFFVPSGLGIQELGLISVGHLLGLNSDAAIALSLAKRTREILFGLPALAAWRLLIHSTGVTEAPRGN